MSSNSMNPLESVNVNPFISIGIYAIGVYMHGPYIL